ncbi:MAG: YkgJ family cysteine cluster protein [Chitinispirillaceae bacterium]
MKQNYSKPKAPIPVPPAAKNIHQDIVNVLIALLDSSNTDPLDSHFRNSFTTFLSLFEDYQKAIIASSRHTKTCTKGCAWCCNHWVEDVNSFEAQIIAEYIRNNLSHKMDEIIHKCKEDLEVLKDLDRKVNRKLELLQFPTGLDSVNLLLSSFYQLERPCPLLNEDGSCSVYLVRPLTCRIYMSFSDPVRCSPNNINDGEVVTYLMDLEEYSNHLLDELHFRFCRHDGDTGLRSVLVKYLEM